jgi:hypothetical protein
VLGTQDWWAAQDHDERVCGAIARAADLARSIEYGRDYAASFTDRLNEHLRETGITLPARLGGYLVADDGDGGFVVRRAG